MQSDNLHVDRALRALKSKVTVTELRIHKGRSSSRIRTALSNSSYCLTLHLGNGDVIKAQKMGHKSIRMCAEVHIQKVEGELEDYIELFKVDGGLEGAMLSDELLKMLTTDNLIFNNYYTRNSLMYVYHCAKLLVKEYCDLARRYRILALLKDTKDSESSNVFRSKTTWSVFGSKFMADGKVHIAPSLLQKASQDVIVTELIIYERPLSFLKRFDYKAERRLLGFLKHDYLIVCLGNGERIVAQILASGNACTGEGNDCSGHGSSHGIPTSDMNGNSQSGAGHAGIHIDKWEDGIAATVGPDDDKLEDDQKRYRFEFVGERLPLQLGTVLHILQAGDVHYHAVSNNCWSYAYRCAKLLVTTCCPDSDQKTAGLKQLKHAKRARPDRIAQMVLHPMTEKSSRTFRTCLYSVRRQMQQVKEYFEEAVERCMLDLP